MTRSVGIIGAGLAGVGVAHALTGGASLHAATSDGAATPGPDGSVESVRIFEKSRGVGGRAATRRRNGTEYYYDHGANYVKEADSRTVELVRSLGEEGLVGFDEPVWPFDGGGEIAASQRDPETKFTWETGITQFAKRLLGESDATVDQPTRVAGLTHDAGSWTVRDDDGETHGPFDAVVCTPPAPQTAELLGNTALEQAGGDTAIDEETISTLRQAVTDVPFRTTRTVVLGYERPLDRPWYALVNTDGGHRIGWLAREECKDGHVPDGESVLIAQLAPDYSEQTYDEPLETVAPAVADDVASLVGEPWLADPDWTDDQGWRYAQPNETLADLPALDRAERAGLFFAGDWLVPDGKGRVHEAYWHGVETAERITDGV